MYIILFKKMKGDSAMKKNCSALLVLLLALSFVFQVSAADTKTNTLDKQITQLQSEINKLQKEMKTLGIGLNVVAGTVMSQKPYILKDCSGVGDACTTALLSGVKYFVIKNPKDGTLNNGYMYGGTHKYMGTTTITVNNKKCTAYVFGKPPNLKRWREIGDIIKQKTAKLEELKIKKETANVNLSKYIYNDEDDSAHIVMQVGNSKMCKTDGKLVSIDSSNKVSPIIVNDAVMVPINPILKNYGGKIIYDNGSKKYTITLDKKIISISVNSKSAKISYKGENKTVTLESPAKVVNSNLLVPTTFLPEIAGMGFEWNEYYKVIRVTYSDPDWAETELENSVTTANSGDYTFKYEPFGIYMTYDKSWGKPIYQSETDPEFPSILLKNDNSFVSIYHNQIPSEDELNYYENDEVIPLSSTNTGIEKIYIDRNKTGGLITIIGENGSLTQIDWSTPNYFCELEYNPNLKSVKEAMDNQVMNMLKTISIYGASG